MTEKQLRQKIVDTAVAWLGCKEADGSHRQIIDTYNSHTPLARGYQMSYRDPWCDAYASAVAIKANMTDIIPTECYCQSHIALFSNLGRWEENDAHTPQPGDYLFFNWEDGGRGDTTGHADHVGIVTMVYGTEITVIEGNKGNAVSYRTMQVNGRYIRGYGLPDYASKATESGPGEDPEITPATPAEVVFAELSKKYGDTLAELMTEGAPPQANMTRRARVELLYNGASVSTKMADYQTEITYTDPASGEADSLDIAIHDRERRWTAAWLPVAGDTLSAIIAANDWEQTGDNRILPCGFFILDNYEFSGWPAAATISAVSVPADGNFMATARTKTWENVTIQEIGKEIAHRAGVKLAWDVEGEPFTIKSMEQSEQTDCEFYMSLCETYGLAMKVYAQKIVVYDREAYKAKEPAGKITEADIETWSWSKSLAGTYTGGEFTYTDPATEAEIKVNVGAGKRILKLSGKADSEADAERQIQAAVNNANHGSTKFSATIMGTANLVASQCVTVVGLGKLSGKYFIDSISHHISGSGGYTMDLEMSLVKDMTEEVIKDATERLAAVGVMNTPSYWVDHYKDINYLDGLILNMATRIKVNMGGSSITTVDAALAVLTATGVINSPDYWAAKYSALAWLDQLIINAANALTQ